MAGRPTSYTPKRAIAICALLAEGRSLTGICKADNMPSIMSVYRWLAVNASFRELYARAREDQADTLADEIVDIADDGSRDYVKDATDKIVVDHDHIARSRLRVDARKWVAAKLKPKKYGDRLDLGGSGVPVSFQLIGSDKVG